MVDAAQLRGHRRLVRLRRRVGFGPGAVDHDMSELGMDRRHDDEVHLRAAQVEPLVFGVRPHGAPVALAPRDPGTRTDTTGGGGGSNGIDHRIARSAP
jgi:hypothetical protein